MFERARLAIRPAAIDIGFVLILLIIGTARRRLQSHRVNAVTDAKNNRQIKYPVNKSFQACRLHKYQINYRLTSGLSQKP